MFRFHCKKEVLLQNKCLFKQYSSPDLNLNLLTTTTTTRSISISISSSSSSSSTTNNNSFTVSYLMNSCGLSHQQALSASQKVQFKTSSKPDSVLTLLKNYGFTNTHISIFVQRRPTFLLSNPDKNLKPKFDYFRSIGFSNPDLAKVISNDPTVLGYSLEKKIIPSYAFLKPIVQTDSNFIKMLRRSTWIFGLDHRRHLVPNIALLQTHGVPQSNISMALATYSRMLLLPVDRFNALVNEVKEMGFDPLKSHFIYGIQALSSLKQPVWELKVEVYKRWGWSDDDIRMAFMKQPFCMTISQKKIMKTMDFLVNKMRYDPLLLAANPIILKLSLEKRVIPRCSILHILISNGLIKKKYSLTSTLLLTDKYFLKNFVAKFEKEAPQLLGVYQGKVNGLELPIIDMKVVKA